MRYDEPGTYELIYKAIDQCGNEKTATREVTVESQSCLVMSTGSAEMEWIWGQSVSFQFPATMHQAVAPGTQVRIVFTDFKWESDNPDFPSYEYQGSHSHTNTMGQSLYIDLPMPSVGLGPPIYAEVTQNEIGWERDDYDAGGTLSYSKIEVFLENC